LQTAGKEVFWRENDIDINKSKMLICKLLLFSCCAVQLLCVVELNTGTKLLGLGFRVKIRVRVRVRFRIRLGLGSEQQVRMKLGLQAD